MGELATKPIVLVAMGGHAFMQKGEKGTIEEHERNAAEIARLLMTLVEKEYQLVITHGNGPQVGTLLLQQECSKDETPSMPLDVQKQRCAWMHTRDAAELFCRARV